MREMAARMMTYLADAVRKFAEGLVHPIVLLDAVRAAFPATKPAPKGRAGWT